MRRFAIAEAVFLVVSAITPCWAASSEPDIQIPNAVDPVFFTLGGGSLGPHVTANGGALILFVMTDRAMAKFKKLSNWSLSSAPGMAIVSYSAATPQDLSGHGS